MQIPSNWAGSVHRVITNVNSILYMNPSRPSLVQHGPKQKVLINHVLFHSMPKPSAFEMAIVSFCFSCFRLLYGGKMSWLKQVWAIGSLQENQHISKSWVHVEWRKNSALGVKWLDQTEGFSTTNASCCAPAVTFMPTFNKRCHAAFAY